MSVVAEHLNLKVMEWGTGYDICYHHNKDSNAHWMGDGVDMMFQDVDGIPVPISPGTQEFNDALQKDLEESYMDYIEAYFPDVTEFLSDCLIAINVIRH